MVVFRSGPPGVVVINFVIQLLKKDDKEAARIQSQAAEERLAIRIQKHSRNGRATIAQVILKSLTKYPCYLIIASDSKPSFLCIYYNC